MKKLILSFAALSLVFSIYSCRDTKEAEADSDADAVENVVEENDADTDAANEDTDAANEDAENAMDDSEDVMKEEMEEETDSM